MQRLPVVMPGSVNAPTIMIGEKAAELVAAAHGARLEQAVGAG